MNHQNAATIGGDVDSMFLNRNIPVSARKRAHEFVVISRDVNNRHALARLAQNLLDHVVVLLWPIATASQLPDVDQIADDIELLAIVIAQELKHRLGVACPGPEMKTGDPRRANTMQRLVSRRWRFK